MYCYGFSGRFGGGDSRCLSQSEFVNKMLSNLALLESIDDISMVERRLLQLNRVCS
jgi:hypothetical protein